ncbi:hypothetical protein AMTR_s00013p00197550 [Amborella trichopoda]|uniref:Glucan endo-1,3-beta-D-glucosidase n=1 Tax=Amborella trichopoda TaxID=13333 RepID=W1PIY6_AMBTC|nr:hypothetical protein AMTR_s00013p00197550 [Amborella trichopoda]
MDGWFYSLGHHFSNQVEDGHAGQVGDAGGIVGVNWGMVADNLPAPADTVKLLKANRVPRVRLFDPNPGALDALRKSGISVALGHPQGPSKPICRPGDAESPECPENLSCLPTTAVTTAIHMETLGTSYPPSQGAFTEPAAGAMRYIAPFLSTNNFPLLLNVYPFFAYASDPVNINLDYALFRPTAPAVQDGPLTYNNLFDASVDAVYSAMDKVGGSTVRIVISESGWPSGGQGDKTTPALAQEYNNGLIQHVVHGNGTPKRPGIITSTYLFALFNENKKTPGLDQNFGLFYPDMNPVYPISFSFP